MSKYCMQKQGPALYIDCSECSDCWNDAFFCLVVGSRTFDDYEFLKSKLDKLLVNQTNVVIVSGGARGADTLAEQYAKEKGFPVVVFEADWEKFGKAAGYIRNEKMHEYISHASNRGVVAFCKNKSSGTMSNIPLAKKYNHRIVVCEV